MSKDAKNISANRWLSLLWASGAAIYGWLLVGAIHKHRNSNIIWDVPLGAGLAGGAVSFLVAFVICWFVSGEGKASSTEKTNAQGALTPIIVTLLPALFFVSALATLVLTLATYNGDWVDARQGLATAFASLIAAVGVVVSVAVSYKSGEENRLAQEKNLVTQLKAQQDNLKTQLEYQREIEDEKGKREERKQDAELIKTLNDRLHEIIPRRYGDKPSEVSASYFQLTALYKDWETLANSSKLVEGQKESQQRNILKILFGVYQEEEKEPNTSVADTEAAESTSEQSQQKKPGGKSRSQSDIRTLNSVIQDIFPAVKEDGDSSEDSGEQKNTKVFDLSYLDLQGLDLSKRYLKQAILKGAHLEGANLWGAHLEGANLESAHLEGAVLGGAHLEGANLWDTHLEGAYLQDAHLEGADLQDAYLERANLADASLERANLWGASLEGAHLWSARLEGARFFSLVENKNNPEARQRVINQLKIARSLPFPEPQLYWAHGFDMGLAHQIFHAHQEYWAEEARKQEEGGTHQS